MTTVRQDAWSTDEDLILAEVVLRHIREGSTQLAAFEEVGERLSRTSAACGFRWNSAIRKKYESAIQLAKKQRSKGKRELVDTEWQEEAGEELNVQMEQPIEGKAEQDGQEENQMKQEKSLTMEEVLAFLKEYHETMKDQMSEAKIEQLKRENEELKQKLEKIEKEKKIMADDYRALLSIMDRARRLSI